MNLQELVSLAEIVSAFAVVLTLIVLIISIRQNTKSQKALVVDSLATAITSINVPAMESSALGSALAKVTADWSSANREERIIAHYFLFSLFKLLETPGISKKPVFLTRRTGSDGKACFESITIPKECVGSGGRVANMPIRRNFKSTSRQPSRQTISVA